MKNSINKDNKKYIYYTLIFVAVVLGFFLVFTNSQNKEVPKNEIKETKSEVSQVLVIGDGYTFNKEQEQVYKEKEEKKEEAQKEKEKEEVNQNTSKDNSGTEEAQGDTSNNGGQSGGDSGDSSGGGGEDISKLPRIKTDLKNGATYGGSFRGFYVKAIDYKDRPIKMTDGGEFTVYANNQKLYSTGGSNHEKVTYKITPILDGENTVKITVTDKYGNKSTLNIVFNGDANGEQEEEGYVRFSVEAKSLGLGTIVSGSEKVYVGDQGSMLFDRFLKARGYGYNHTGTLTNGFYIKDITKPGITNGFKIQDDIMEHLLDEGYSEAVHYHNKLGEKHFTNWSGWTLMINGEYPDQGLSSYVPKDGDIVRIRYTLWNHKDLNGDWGNY